MASSFSSRESNVYLNQNELTQLKIIELFKKNIFYLISLSSAS